jgi:protein TonB
MKSTSHVFEAAAVSMLGLLVALAGCANTPTRLATTEAASSPALIERVVGNWEAPVPEHTVRPRFPDEMRRAGNSGVVNVKCLIDENGVVREAEAVTASDRGFEQPALEAVRQWTFKPARRDGVPVAQRAMIPINFTLTED